MCLHVQKQFFKDIQIFEMGESFDATPKLVVNAKLTTNERKVEERLEERKRAKGKKGTVYEEEYLVNSIERLIERLNSMGEDIERLIEGLLKRGMRERAGAVSAAVEDVKAKCDEVVAELYTTQENPKDHEGLASGNGVGVDGKDMLRPQGADATLWDSLEEISRRREAPVVKAFERLSLLG